MLTLYTIEVPGAVAKEITASSPIQTLAGGLITTLCTLQEEFVVPETNVPFTTLKVPPVLVAPPITSLISTLSFAGIQ
ncbi:hypothetical protein D3C80_1275980 [compost metagenome]